MQLTVLGGSGPWPVAGQGCSGYVVTSGQTVLLLDPGPGTCGDLLARHAPHDVSAVLISHGHADHTADLAVLLRARRMADPPAPPLPVYAPPGALDGVLALDVPEVVSPSVHVHEVVDGDQARIGDVEIAWRSLPHHVPNLGVRLRAGGGDLVYTGDTGSSDALDELAAGADVLLADATYSTAVPPEDRGLLGSPHQAGATATRAGCGLLVLTHLWPGTDAALAEAQARQEFAGPIEVAQPGWQVPIPPAPLSR